MQEQEIALFPLHTVLFPGMVLPLRVFEDRYLRLMREVLRGERTFGVVLIREGSEVGGPAVPYPVGTTARLLEVTPSGTRRVQATLVGVQPFEIREILRQEPYLLARIRYQDCVPGDSQRLADLTSEALRCLQAYLRLLCQLADREPRELPEGLDAETLSYVIASTLEAGMEERQLLLEQPIVADRLATEIKILRRERQLLAYLASMKEQGAGPWRSREGLAGRFSPN